MHRGLVRAGIRYLSYLGFYISTPAIVARNRWLDQVYSTAEQFIKFYKQPGPAGSVVSTGEGQTNPPGVDGKLAASSYRLRTCRCNS